MLSTKQRRSRLPILIMAISLLCLGAVLAGLAHPTGAAGPPAPATATHGTPDLSISSSGVTVHAVGQIGGGVLNVAVEGHYAYTILGPRLAIFDVAEAGSPTMLGQTEVLPGTLAGLAIAGGFAYVAAGDAGLHIIDVSDPAQPAKVASFDTPGAAQAVAVAGGYAFVADGAAGGLQIANVADPAHPTGVGACQTPGDALDLAVSGEYAFIADGAEGLRVVDIVQKATPREVGFYKSLLREATAIAVAVANGYAYVADNYKYVQIVDVADPTAPTLARSILPGPYWDELSQASWDVAVDGNRAYVVTSRELVIVDISAPRAPVRLGSFVLGSSLSARHVAAAGTTCYIADRYQLRVLDVQGIALPRLAGTLVDVKARSVKAAGVYAYALTGTGLAGSITTLQVIDARDPASMQTMGDLRLWDNSSRLLAVGGGVAYVSTMVSVGSSYTGSLTIVDVADPWHPAVAGQYTPPAGYVRSVVVSPPYAYLTSSAGGLHVLDVRDPFHPVLTSSQDIAGGNAMVVVGPFLYMGSSAGLRVFSLSNRGYPLLVNTYSAWRPYYLAAGNAQLFLEQSDNSGISLRVLDVSEPTHPVERSACNAVWDGPMVVSDGYAYVADHSLGIIGIYDASSPSDLRPAGYIDAPNETSIDLVGHTLYLADKWNSFEAYDVAGLRPPRQTGSSEHAVLPGHLTLDGSMAYTTDWHREPGGALSVIDIANPAAPVLLGSSALTRRGLDLDQTGSTAYVCGENDTSGWLDVVDVGDPSRPRVIGSIDLPDATHGVEIIGEAVYAFGIGRTPAIVDVSQSSNPSLFGYCDACGNAYAMADAGRHLYVIAAGGFRVVDVSDPWHPSLVNAFALSHSPSSAAGSDDAQRSFAAESALLAEPADRLAVAGNYAYSAGGGSAGLAIIDVSNPQSPAKVSGVGLPYTSSGQSVAVLGHYALVGTRAYGVRVFDVSNPTFPAEVAWYPLNDVYAMRVAGDYVYMAAGTQGLRVFRLGIWGPTPTPTPTLTGTPTATAAATHTPSLTATSTATATATPSAPWLAWGVPERPLLLPPTGSSLSLAYGNVAAPAMLAATLSGAAAFPDGRQVLTIPIRASSGALLLALRPRAGSQPGEAFALRVDLAGLSATRGGVLPWQGRLPLAIRR